MDLDEKQKSVIRWFQNTETGPLYTYEAITGANDLSDDQYEWLIQYLWRIEAVTVEPRGGDPIGAVRLGPKFKQLIYDLDNLPKPDVWERWAKSIRSKWWSFPLCVVLVGIPLFLNWVDIIFGVLAMLFQG